MTWTPSTAGSASAASSSKPATAPTASVHRKLVLNNPTSDGEGSTKVVFADTKGDNKPVSIAQAKAPAPPKAATGREVIIDGIAFVSDANGKKLVRKERTPQPSSKSTGQTCIGTAICRVKEADLSKPVVSTPTTSSGPLISIISRKTKPKSGGTPVKATFGGQSYVRTKSGNLVKADLVKKREMAEKRKRLDNLVGIIKNNQKARRCATTERLKSGESKRQIHVSLSCSVTNHSGAKAGPKSPMKPKTLCRYFQKTGGTLCIYILASEQR